MLICSAKKWWCFVLEIKLIRLKLKTLSCLWWVINKFQFSLCSLSYNLSWVSPTHTSFRDQPETWTKFMFRIWGFFSLTVSFLEFPLTFQCLLFSLTDSLEQKDGKLSIRVWIACSQVKFIKTRYLSHASCSFQVSFPLQNMLFNFFIFILQRLKATNLNCSGFKDISSLSKRLTLLNNCLAEVI